MNPALVVNYKKLKGITALTGRKGSTLPLGKERGAALIETKQQQQQLSHSAVACAHISRLHIWA